MLNKYAIFTKHSQDRLRECQINLPKAVFMLYSGTKEKLPKELAKAKNKYSDEAIYIRNGTIIFTLIDSINKITKEDIYLVVSVYDQQIGLGIYEG